MNAEQQQAYDWAKSHDYPSIAARYARALADTVESHQAHIAELEAQLAESQRREQAAVEDLKLALIDEALDPCHCCEYGCTDHCAHPDGPTCGETGGKNWKWSGPQQAGDGGHDTN